MKLNVSIRTQRTLGLLVLLIGATSFLYSLSLEPFTDQKLFWDSYLNLEAGQSEEFWALRTSLLSNKYLYEDYGLLAFILGALILVFAGRKLRVPTKKLYLVAIAFLAPAVTISSSAAMLFQSFYRLEFPHWADSLAIPLMGFPIQLAALLFWSTVHLGYLNNNHMAQQPLALALGKEANIWLRIMSYITAGLTLLFAIAGAYMFVTAGLMWLYFYLSLSASKIVMPSATRRIPS